jgi:hypothetical protein
MDENSLAVSNRQKNFRPPNFLMFCTVV